MSNIETAEVGEIITAQQINQQALHSMQVMEQWGNGEVYNEATWIERGRQAVVKTLEGMFELGKTLIVLKEHMTWEKFADVCEVFGISTRTAQQLTQATKRFAMPAMQKAQPKLIGLGKSKLLELLIEEDDTLVDLSEGKEVKGLTLDDVDRMTVRELRVALREAREDSKAKDKVMSEKNAKIDELAEKLAKNKNKQPKPADVAKELSAQLASAEVSARSEISKLKDIFDGLVAHKEAHGSDHTALMVGAINQLILDCEILRGQYLLPTDAPTGEVPVWLTQDEPVGADDRDMPLPFDYSEDEV